MSNMANAEAGDTVVTLRFRSNFIVRSFSGMAFDLRSNGPCGGNGDRKAPVTRACARAFTSETLNFAMLSKLYAVPEMKAAICVFA